MAMRVATINGRGILELPPMGNYVNPWFVVEVAPFAYRKQDTLDDAVALANHLGPISN